MDHQRYHVSWHVRDLLKRDINAVYDVHKWLETNAVKQRDIDNRKVSKRMLARKIAAQLCVSAAEGDLAAAREVMDRTEGKVVDVVITGSMGDMVKALEAGRTRLLELRNPPAIEGTVVTDPTESPIQTDSLPEDPHKQ